MQKPMTLRLNKPHESGIVTTQGTELLTSDGSQVTGIKSIRVDLGAEEGLMVTTVELLAVAIEYKQSIGVEKP